MILIIPGLMLKPGQDTIIEPFTYIHGEVTIGQNCRIGPLVYLHNGTQLDDNIVISQENMNNLTGKAGSNVS